MTPRQAVTDLLVENLPDHAEAWYVATILATGALSWALLTIARALTAATKETP